MTYSEDTLVTAPDASESLFGRRSMHGVIESRAHQTPQRTFADIIRSTSPTSIKAVSYSNLSNAISKAAWLIQERLGTKGPQQQTLWYSGTSDLRYLVFVLAASRTGNKAVLISPKNTQEAHLRLLRATSCRHVFVSGTNPTISRIAAEGNLEVHTFPTLDSIMWLDNVPPYPVALDFEAIADNPVVILHTSASTNHPKPITWTHKNFAVMDSFHNLPPIQGEKALALEHHSHNRLFLGFPLFHAAAWNQLTYCVFFETIPVFGPPESSLSKALFEDVLALKAFDSAALPPSIVEELAQSSAVANKLVDLDYLMTGGAPLTQAAGDKLSHVTRLLDLVGSTECNCFPELRLSKKSTDWAYHNFHPSLGLEFRPHMDDMYEAIFVRDKSLEQFQAAFVTFPGLTEYTTHDLYSRHPTEPNLWLYRGRKDNVIVLSNGEKFQPDEVEATLAQQPDIHEAFVVGQNRFQPGLILSPVVGKGKCLDDSRLKTLLNLANAQLPAHAQLEPSHIRIIKQGTDLPRSLKGKLQRLTAFAVLDAEIKSLYQQAEDKPQLVKLDVGDQESLEDSIRKVLLSFGPRFQHLPPESNLFDHGMDSLTAVRFWRILKASVEYSYNIALDQTSSRMIYENPSLHQLASAVGALGQGKYSKDKSEQGFGEMQDAIRDSMALLPASAVKATRRIQGPKKVILTGSTGSLGCQVLDCLMRSADVGTIHCLNRSTDSATRQMAMHRERGFRHDFTQRNVKFHTSDLSKDGLGLAQDNNEMYKLLLESVDCVIHLAWSVNWTEPFSSFAPQLKGCCNLVHFAAASSRRPRIVFASSVGAANSASSPIRTVREEALTDLKAADPSGYSQSKLVAEHIFQQASCSPLCIPITICRIGQIAGSTSGGAWKNTHEWFPSLIAASSCIKALPQSLGHMDAVDWIPVDVLAESLTGLALDHDIDQFKVSASMLKMVKSLRREAKASATYVHLVNPTLTSWSQSLLPAAISSMSTAISVVPLQQWVDSLETKMKEDISLEESSAGRLLEFYKRISRHPETLPSFETSRALQMCPSMQSLLAIQADWLKAWMAGWDKSSTCERSSSMPYSEDYSEKKREHDVDSSYPRAHNGQMKVHGLKSLLPTTGVRAVLCTVAQRLQERLEPASSCVDRLRFEPACSSAVRVALDAGWLDQLSLKKPMTAQDLVKSGQSGELLVRTFRVLSSARLLVEVGEQRYKANRRTLQLCDEGSRSGLSHWFDNMAPTFCQLPTYFASNGFTEPTSQELGPFAHTFDSQTYWQRLVTDPVQHATFNRYMQAHKKQGCSLAALFPTARLTLGFDQTVSDTLLVDIGGGKGHHLLDLAAHLPNLPGRLVLEDLPETLPLTGTPDATLLEAAHITAIPHNFFEPQPIAGARYYYFSAIFHDWPDSFCQTIIKHTAAAMRPGYSRLLINGIILPERGASYFAAAKDWGMMAAMSGKERTLLQMQALVACVPGLRVAQVWYGPRGKDSVLECELSA